MGRIFNRFALPGIIPIILVINLFVAVSNGQEWSEIKLLPGNTQTIITDIRAGGFKVTQSISALSFSEVHTEYGRFTRIEGTGYSTADEYGKPLLPVIGNLIEIPPGAETEVKILSYREEVIDLGESGFHFPLYPYQPAVSKGTQDNKTEFIYQKKSYLDDSFTQQNLAEVEELGIMRGRRLGRIIISPFRYNPVKNQIRVMSEISIEIVFTGSAGVVSNAGRFASPLFESALSSRIINYRESRIKSHTGMVPEKYLILADPMFEEELKEFVNWKTEKGFNVIELYRGKNGVGESQAEMRSALSEIYHSATPENPAPSFLLIVGDHDQIPAFQSAGHITDLYYAEYDGNGDFFPDLFYGRFSANNISELRPQIEKTLMYEKYLFPDPSFLSESVFIAGVDSRYAHIHGNGQVNYASGNYFNDSNGINSHNWLVPHAPGTPDKIKSLIYEGVSLINYTGHGYEDRWENPRFSIFDVPEMDNFGKYPLMIGNGCETNKFNIYECLGEALLRANNKGAVGYIGASNDSYWDEDFYWAVGVGPISSSPSFDETGQGIYDKLFDIDGGNTVQSHIAQGQIQQAGNLAVTEGTTIERAKYYWEIYHLMGDPSLAIWFSEPPQASVRYPASIASGTTEMVVSAEPNTYVAFSGDGQLIAAGYTNNSGIATLSFDPVEEAGIYKLVATSASSQPYIGEIQAAEFSSAFITLMSFTISDSLSNKNGIAEAGENTGIDFIIKNSGAYPGGNLELYLQSNNSHVNPHDIKYTVTNIEPGEEISITGVFGLDISSQVTDGESVLLSMVIKVNDTLNTVIDFALDIAAPGIEIVKARVADTDGFLMAGQMALMVFDIHNKGSAAISNAEFHVEESSFQVLFEDNSSTYGLIEPGDTISILYNVFANQDIAYGSTLKFDITTNSEGFISENEVHFIVNAVFDDFEDGDITYSPWETATENGWFLTNDSQSGNYSIRSGDISHTEKSELSVSMEVEDKEYISFLKKLSTERDYDFLEFYIDGQLEGKWSGMINWSRVKFVVNPGLRNFRWVYTKDQSVSMGHDCVWIDEVIFPPGTLINNKVQPPGNYDIVLTRFISPLSGMDLGNSEVVEVEIENRGNMEIIGLEMRYQINDLEPVSEFISEVIKPGTILTYAFNQTADFSMQGLYRLSVSLAGYDETKAIFHNLDLDIENLITYISGPENLTVFNVYPNPFSSHLSVDFVDDSKFHTINIYSVRGQLLYNLKVNNTGSNKIFEFETSGLPSGTYIIEVISDRNRFVRKLIRR